MTNNAIVRKMRKDNYLSELIEWMANDDLFNRIFDSTLKEVDKDYQILRCLIDSGKFHLEITRDEISGAYSEEKLKSSKSRIMCQKHLTKAQYLVGQRNYSTAAHSYAKVMVKQPLLNEQDYQSLAELYLCRAQCFIQMKDEEAAAMDFQFAMTADHAYCMSRMSEKDHEILGHYKTSISMLCGDLGGLQAKIGHRFEVVYDHPEQSFRLMPSEEVPADTMVCVERPLVKYSCTTFDNCARCDKYIRDFLYWPCQFCSDMVFCSRECYEKEFEFHKYECGLSRYASQIPLMILMLRFYFRTGTCPAFPCPVGTDFIARYLQMFDKQQNKEISGQPEPFFLNVFRQCMDGHEKRSDLLRKNKRHYYACLIMAVEFTFLYDALLFNGRVVQNQKDQFPCHANLETDLESESALSPPMPESEFKWAKSSDQDTVVHLIVDVFRDLKRFAACPFSKFEVQPIDHRSNVRKERRILLLCGIFFSPQQQQQQQQQQHLLATNLVPIYHRHCGLIEVRSSRPILKGEKLLLNKNILVNDGGNNGDSSAGDGIGIL